MQCFMTFFAGQKHPIETLENVVDVKILTIVNCVDDKGWLE